MQTRKKVVAGNTSLTSRSSKLCRNQKRNTVVAEKTVTELITSSAQKQKPGGVALKKDRGTAAVKSVNKRYSYPKNEKQSICMQGDERTGERVLDTIFSPTFHINKDVRGNICENGNKLVDHQAREPENGFDCHVPLKPQRKSSLEISTEPSTCPYVCGSEESGLQNIIEYMHHEEYENLEDLSLVSSATLTTQNSRLECVDEPCHDIVPTEDCIEVAEEEDLEDFDPYYFIRNLPDLEAVVPSFRPMLLPKQTRSCPSTTLVLDLDETLVHSSLDYCENVDFTFAVNFNQKEHTVYVRCRPCLNDFLERVSRLFEIVVFTASQSVYGEQLLNVLDPKRRIFRHRVYRESCVFVDGNYLKDLSVLGRDLARVIIIDNSPQAFGFQVDNGIPIASWFDDHSDRALLSLLPFLESLVGVEDVRPLIAREFNLRGKVAAATCRSMIF